MEDVDGSAVFDLTAAVFDCVVGPDVLPVLTWRGREACQVGPGALEHGGDLGEPGVLAVRDLVVVGNHRVRGGLHPE